MIDLSFWTLSVSSYKISPLLVLYHSRSCFQDQECIIKAPIHFMSSLDFSNYSNSQFSYCSP
jgi:hypothetical protein